MSAIRQDAWSEDDDLVLAEVTLRHIREGSTQLTAFEEVGEQIGRTAAACGFRWNSYVRKKYESAIQIAKEQRHKHSHYKKSAMQTRSSTNVINLMEESNENYSFKSDAKTDESMTTEGVIRFLRQSKALNQERLRQIKNLQKELNEKKEENEKLKIENDELAKRVNAVQTDYSMVNDDYRALIQIMDRARKLSFLVPEEEEHKPRFKMDANGNLERID